MAGKNNRRLGVLTELEFIKRLCQYFGLIPYNKDSEKDGSWQIASSRAVSKVTDNQGIDVCFSRVCPGFLSQFAFQIKRTTVTRRKADDGLNININPLLTIQHHKTEIPALVTHVYEKRGKASRRVDDVVILKLNDFLDIVNQIKDCEKKSDL